MRAARIFLEKLNPQYQQLKEEAKEEGENRGVAGARGGVCPGFERTFYQPLHATVVFFLSTLGSKSIPGHPQER